MWYAVVGLCALAVGIVIGVVLAWAVSDTLDAVAEVVDV